RDDHLVGDVLLGQGDPHLPAERRAVERVQLEHGGPPRMMARRDDGTTAAAGGHVCAGVPWPSAPADVAQDLVGGVPAAGAPDAAAGVGAGAAQVEVPDGGAIVGEAGG